MGVLGARVPRSHPEDLRLAGVQSLQSSWKVEEQGARGADRIVPDALDREHGQPRRDDGSELPWVLEHLVVVRDEPRIAELV
jgi:hypothetical protein